MICVECGAAVPDVYKDYGGAGNNIRLSHCERCGKIADKYVEYEFVIIFIDLLLLRLQVYRHLLFNRMAYHDWGIDILLIYLAFDAYLRYLSIEENGGFSGLTRAAMGKLTIPILPLSTYFWVILVSIVEYLSFICGVAIAASYMVGKNYAIIKYNYLLMALIISSFAKPLYMFLMLWGQQKMFAIVLDVFVLTSNVAAMRAFLGDSNQAFLAVGVGHGIRTLLKGVLHFSDPTFFPLS